MSSHFALSCTIAGKAFVVSNCGDLANMLYHNFLQDGFVKKDGPGELPMITFTEIESRAAQRKGGSDALESLLYKPLPMNEIAEIPEDRWLAEFTRCIFQA